MVVPLFTAAVFPDAILRLHHSDFPQARFWPIPGLPTTPPLSSFCFQRDDFGMMMISQWLCEMPFG
jgi:hypothetical protein